MLINLRRRWRLATAAAMAMIAAAAALALTATAPPPDLGRVRWSHDLQAARREANRDGRPIMLLSRGPGSDPASRAFGTGPLSHPIVIDAAGEFVTAVADDRSPSGPAVRFTDADGKDLVPPPSDKADRSAAKLLADMAAALHAAGRAVPPYLDLVATEYNPLRKQTATFAFTCYWKGEKELGHLDGVLGTRTGLLGGEEVVEVDFDPAAVDYRALAATATGIQCFRRAYAHSADQQAAAAGLTDAVSARPAAPLDASDQQQYRLSLEPTWHFLPLTGLQATKVNSALARGELPEPFLSPGQIALHRRLQRLVAKDRRALFGLEQSMKPDRSPEGLPAYAAEIERRVSAME